MQLNSCIVAVAALASTAVAVKRDGGFAFPATVGELERRQVTGERYECHANCGYALQGAGEDAGYCDDAEWNELFQGCLDCALEFDIWRHYGGGLTPAAEACGLDATPRPAGGDDDAATTSDEPAPPPTSDEPAPPPPTSSADSVTDTPGETVTTDTPAETTAVDTPVASSSWTSLVSTTDVPTTTGNGTAPTNGTTTTDPNPVPTAMGAQNMVSSFLVAGAAVMVAVNLM